MTTRNLKGNCALIIDTDTSTSFVYIGRAEKGSVTSGSVWNITRIDITEGAKIEQAESGDSNLVWDDRVGLTYAL